MIYLYLYHIPQVRVPVHHYYLLGWRSPGSRHHFQIPKLAIHWTYFVTLKFNALSVMSEPTSRGFEFKDFKYLTSYLESFNIGVKFISYHVILLQPTLTVIVRCLKYRWKSFKEANIRQSLTSLIYFGTNAIVLTPQRQVPWQHNLSFVQQNFRCTRISIYDHPELPNTSDSSEQNLLLTVKI